MDMYTLFHAAIAGDADAIAELEKQADGVNQYGDTILHIHSGNGNEKLVQFILREFVSKNLLVKFNLCKQTALHLAAGYGRTEVAELLIDAARRYLPSSSSVNDDQVTSFEVYVSERNEDSYQDLNYTLHMTPSSANPIRSFEAFVSQADHNQVTALHKAVEHGNMAIVKMLVEANPTDRHIQDYKGDTPIYIAVKKGYIDILKVICTTCTAPSFAGPRGSTAFHAAIKSPYHSIQMVEILISADNNDKASLRQSDEDLNTALHIAAMEGKVDIAKLLVEADPSNTHTQNKEGKTPIYIAAEKGCTDIVTIICTTCTVPPNLDGPAGATALHAAIKNLHQVEKDGDVIRTIIDTFKLLYPSYESSGSSSEVIFVELFNKTDEHKCTILEMAVELNYLDVVELILDSDPAYQYEYVGKFLGLVPLIYKAIERDSKDIVKLLTANYEDIVERNTEPIYQLVHASISAIRSRQRVSVLEMLRLSSYDVKLVNFADNLGWTLLHHAAYHQFDSILSALVEAQRGYDDMRFEYDYMVSTPFHVAAKRGYTSTVIRLLELWPPSSSATIIAVDNMGQNILHLAAVQSKKEMIQGILKHCPEKYMNDFVNKQDDNGNTPLHLLIRHGCFVPELIKHKGLDIMVKNKEDLTPLDNFYIEDEIIADQVKIKIALDYIQIDQKKDRFSSSEISISKREQKDVIIKKQANQMIDQMHARMKESTRAFANCFADAIAGDPISKAALEIEADTLQEEGTTILHVESMRGVTERVEFILREFAIKNLLVKLDTSEQTALHLAAHHGRTQVVQALIEAARHLPSSSANDDTHNPIRSFHDFIRQTNGQMGNTALHLAVLNGNVAIVKLLVQADANDNHVQNNEGKTPMYIAAEIGYKDILKEICRTYTALFVDGPSGRTTVLHALVHNAGQGASDMIRMIVQAAKRCSADYEALFCRTDESESTVLQLAVEKNYVDAVELILQEDPAYQHGREIKRNGLMRLIYKAIDDENCSDDITKLLSKAYLAGIDPDHKDVLDLILAMKGHDEDSVLRLLGDAKGLVNFTEDNGWTPLHYAVYHEFDSILGAIIEAQENVEHKFVYGDLVSTPFHVAIEHGYTSTLVRLMQLWPALPSASIDDKSPYTVVNTDDQNILHLAAADNKKEMVQGILKYCPEMYKDKILKQQDIRGDTPLHLLISRGCFIPELIKDEGLDTMAKNKKKFTPWEMLYFKNDVVADQVKIKIAIDDAQTNQSAWNLCAKSTEKKTDIWKNIPQSKLRMKNVIFDEQKIKLKDAEHEQRKKDLERYKMRTNTQIIVTALITTITFTVGFTMPGGLRQSGEVDEGLVLLSKKTAFNAFMVSDALALLLSTSSLFFYFLESMNEDPRQVRKLNAASTVLNIVSVMAMMLTFIAGTYLVLSNSPALAITVCIIGSLFFFLIIFLLIKIVYDRLYVRRRLYVKRN